MVAFCRDEQRAGRDGDFGVVYYQDGMSTVGCTARVGRVLKEYEDGRSELLSLGRRRFRILHQLQDRVYDRAEIEFVLDDKPDWDEDIATQVLSRHRILLGMMAGAEPPDDFYSGHRMLSFLVAQSAGLSLPARQKMLESTSENERLEMLQDHFQTFLPLVKSVEQARQAIHSNWALKKYIEEQSE